MTAILLLLMTTEVNLFTWFVRLLMFDHRLPYQQFYHCCMIIATTVKSGVPRRLARKQLLQSLSVVLFGGIKPK